MNITLQPTCTLEFQGYCNSRLSLSHTVDVLSSPIIPSEKIIVRLTLSAISSALDSISFCPDAMVAVTGRQLCSCDVVLTDGWLAGLTPDTELRRSAGGLVWPNFSVVRWFVCCFALSYAFEEVIHIGEGEYLNS